MKAIKFALVLISITLFTSCSNEEDGIYFNSITESKTTYTKIEVDILTLVNNHRQTKGLQKLITMDFVSGIALSHSKYMVENNKISHDNFPERVSILKNNVNAESVGENVAYGYKSAEAVLKGWLNSLEHKKALEFSGYTHFGISSERDDEGRYYFTQMFIKK